MSIEDPLGEDDWDGWKLAGELLPAGVQLLGDDLFATYCVRIARGVAEGVANAVLVKPNQAGTLTGARQALELAQREGYATVLSARSGESEDAWLADLAVGWRSGPDQGRLHAALRAHREMEPPAAHRGRAARRRARPVAAPRGPD